MTALAVDERSVRLAKRLARRKVEHRAPKRPECSVVDLDDEEITIGLMAVSMGPEEPDDLEDDEWEDGDEWPERPPSLLGRLLEAIFGNLGRLFERP